MISYDNYITYTSISVINNNIHKKKQWKQRNIFNKNERRCRDVKTLKPCEQGWEANI